MFENLSQREKILLGVFGVFLVFSVYYFYLYQPLKAEIAEYQKMKIAKQNQLNQALVFARKLPGAREEYQQLQEIARQKKEYLSLTTDEFLEIIHRLSKGAGINLISLTPREQESVILLETELIGNFHSILSFLVGLRELENRVEYRSMTLQPYEEKLKLRMSLLHDKSWANGGDNP